MAEGGESPAPPAVTHEFHEFEGRRWPLIVLHLLAALIIATSVVYLGRWIYRSSVHTTKTPGKLKNISLKQTSQSPSGSQPAANSATNNLPNNGPGNLVAVFGVTAASAGSLHYVIKRRRGA